MAGSIEFPYADDWYDDPPVKLTPPRTRAIDPDQDSETSVFAYEILSWRLMQINGPPRRRGILA
jgi:hypothetical protein